MDVEDDEWELIGSFYSLGQQVIEDLLSVAFTAMSNVNGDPG